MFWGKKAVVSKYQQFSINLKCNYYHKAARQKWENQFKSIQINLPDQIDSHQRTERIVAIWYNQQLDCQGISKLGLTCLLSSVSYAVFIFRV